jgi:hypothetical protein
MESIESRKANLSGAVFTGGIATVAPGTADSSTTVPTTAWVKGLMNTTSYTFTHNISGNAGTATNASQLSSLTIHTGRNNEANKVVRTDSSGYLQTGYINSSSGDENNASNADRVWGTNGSDSYMRTYRTSSLSVNYASTAGRAYPRRSDGGDLNFYWSGQSGQPTWLWGGSDGANMYVYNPSNFSVNYANSAGSAGSVAWGNVSSKPTLVSLGWSTTGYCSINASSAAAYDDVWLTTSQAPLMSTYTIGFDYWVTWSGATSGYFEVTAGPRRWNHPTYGNSTYIQIYHTANYGPNTYYVRYFA